jgi:hypothetical protein
VPNREAVLVPYMQKPIQVLIVSYLCTNQCSDEISPIFYNVAVLRRIHACTYMCRAKSREMGSFCEIVNNWDKWPKCAKVIRESKQQEQYKKYHVTRLNPKIKQSSMDNLGNNGYLSVYST